jgi:glyoxylase-like metal-dependent hydrolase (beta-lactamase superfamily II)
MRLAPSLHRIGSDLVASYLVADNAGVVVVDAGLSGHWRELVAELASLGRSLVDVRALLLTHGDTDHIGFAERLRRECAVPVYVHRADAARARGEEKARNRWGPVRLRPLLQFLWYGARHGGLRTWYLTDVTPLQGWETLDDLPGAPRVIPVPGHSPGSVAFHFPSVDAIFVGDALTTRHVLTGARGPQPAPFTDDPAQALDSLTAVESISASWVLPGHGPPWRSGAAEAVRRVRAVAARN